MRAGLAQERDGTVDATGPTVNQHRREHFRFATVRIHDIRGKSFALRYVVDAGSGLVFTLPLRQRTKI